MRSSCYTAAVLALLILTGCPGHDNVQCNEDADCDTSGGGVCTLAATGHRWCSFPDPECSSGYRYSDMDVGDGLGGACVEGTRHMLTVQVGGNGAGSISSDPVGLTCSAGTCTGNFEEGILVQLSAVATTGSFLGWAAACRGQGACAVTMDRDQAVGALFGTPGEALWVKQLGSEESDSGRGIAVDSEDNLITVGTFRRTIMPSGMALTSDGENDIYVAKFASSTGNVMWAERFGGAMADNGFGVAVDRSEGIYVAGRFEGTVDFGSGPLQATGPSAVFVLKLDKNGGIRWARKIDGDGFAELGAVATDGTSVALVGSYGGMMTVDATTLTSAGSVDVFVLQMSAATGATTWARSFGGAFIDEAHGAALDRSGNVVLTGNFRGTVNFGGGALSTPGGLDNGFLLKLAASNGAHLLSKQLGGPGFDTSESVAVDSADSIFITGDFQATADFGCAGGLTASQAGVSDIFLVKYSQAGSCIWAKGIGGTATFPARHGFAVTVNSAGDVAITGEFCGSISLGGRTLQAASACPATDMFAARFAGDGTHLNSVRAGGTTGSETGRGITQSSDGRFFVTGEFTGFAEFGGSALTSTGATDAFVVGLAPL